MKFHAELSLEINPRHVWLKPDCVYFLRLIGSEVSNFNIDQPIES